MGKKSRDKGYRAEHEVVLICEREGIPVKRNFMSGMFANSVDLEINCRPVSVKRRANGLAWAYSELEKVDYILFRSDRGKWLKIERWSLDNKKNPLAVLKCSKCGWKSYPGAIIPIDNLHDKFGNCPKCGEKVKLDE